MDKRWQPLGRIFFAARSHWPVYLNVEQQYDPVRSDGNFQDLIRRLTEASLH
jgi:hypothetical protein